MTATTSRPTTEYEELVLSNMARVCRISVNLISLDGLVQRREWRGF